MNIFLFATLSLFCGRIVYSDSNCNAPLFHHATITATSSLFKREPEFASFDGEHSWTASTADTHQYLVFEFAHWMKVNEIVTQGKYASDDFVSAFIVSYGSNGRDYLTYRTSSGHPKVFSANFDGSSLKRITFDVPIIARWIRINPVRWINSISMKVELYGCDYDANQMNFNGSSLITWNLQESPITSTTDSISLRIKSDKADGIILYSRGTLGDYLALQIRENKMVLNINLGSGVQTSLLAGSLLDDNVWHDIYIFRDSKKISLAVDRVTVRKIINDDFSKLNLDRRFYIGGILTSQVGIEVFQNFTGCIDNLLINSVNIWKELEKNAFHSGNEYGIKIYQRLNVPLDCIKQDLSPITFLTEASFVKLQVNEKVRYFDIAFSFRTFEGDGLLMHHNFNDEGYVMAFLEKEKLKIELKMPNSPVIQFQNFDHSFNDGKWNHLSLSIRLNKILLKVNEEQAVTRRFIPIITGSHSYFGGGIPGIKGFLGCMKEITVNHYYKDPLILKLNEELFFDAEIVVDACQMTDKCSPNPCEHGGICRQSSEKFECDCSNTNYVGPICHKAKQYRSCESYKLLNSVSQMENIQIDVDGSGPLEPFPVTCQFHANEMVVTELHLKNEEPVTVDGHEKRGSFVRNIEYLASPDQIEALIRQSIDCRQYIRYDCFRSKLFNSPTIEDNFEPYSWWVSRNGQKMDFWGGALPGSRKCACGILGVCKNDTKWCNCDAGFYEWRSDEGDIRGKEFLPVKQLRFGDTGSLYDDKRGKYTLGPLKCLINDVFENVITFRKADATVDLPEVNLDDTNDIYFEFKTARDNAVLVNARGNENEILVELRGGNTILLSYNVGGKQISIFKQSNFFLTNNKWHSVYVEINVKEIYFILDGAESKGGESFEEPIPGMKLISSFIVGGSISKQNSNGFVGCFRAFILNGEPVDLKAAVKRNSYGLSVGCIGKCDSNPCFNNGFCEEHYDGYSCDCRWTSFKGPICADDIGVAMSGNTMIKYEFSDNDRSTISEKIRIGFVTTRAQGFLFGLFSSISNEYMIASITNSGNLRVKFDFGFERQELIVYSKKNFALGHFHDLRLSRRNSGSLISIQADNYEPEEYSFPVSVSADVQFDKIQYLYVGKNESMDEGFTGCIARVEFDDIYPLKLLFQQNPPKQIKSFPPTIGEDFCGVEPSTLSPEPDELRNEVEISIAYSETNPLLVGLSLICMFAFFVGTIFLVGRYLSNRRAQYNTQEQCGADWALDADTAVMYSKTGCVVKRKREWFL